MIEPTLEMALAVVAGVCALLALPSGVALIAAAKRWEVSMRTMIGLAMVVACAWCAANALHLLTTVPEALLMLVAAVQSVVALRTRRKMRRVADLSPFS